MEDILKEILQELVKLNETCNEQLRLTKEVEARQAKMASPDNIKRQMQQVTRMLKKTPFGQTMTSMVDEMAKTMDPGKEGG